jgi:hypothetical protein
VHAPTGLTHSRVSARLEATVRRSDHPPKLITLLDAGEYIAALDKPMV